MSFCTDFIDAFKTEVEEAKRLPKLWLSALVFPLFWVAVIISMFSSGLMRDLPVAYVDQDRTAQSREIVRTLEAVPSVSLRRFESPQEVVEEMRAGKVYASVLIPQNWSEKSAAGDNASAIELMFAKSYFAIATTLEIDIKSALAAKSMELLGKQAIGKGGGFKGAQLVLSSVSPDVYITGNQAFSYAPYFYSVLIPCVFGVIVILTMIGVFVREWREKRWHYRYFSGMSVSAIFLGKAAPWFLAFAVLACAYVSWFAGYMGFAPVGSVLIWVLGLFLFVLAMMSFALLLVATSPLWVLAMSLGICCSAPILPFTGFSYPFDSMDPIAIGLGHLMPLTWFFRIQMSQWMLASPLSHTLYLMGILSLFIIIPTGISLVILPMRVRRWVRAEVRNTPPKPERLVNGLWAEIVEGPRRGICALDTTAVFLGAMAMYLAFYAWPYMHQTVTGVETAIVDFDKTASSRALIEKLDSTPALKVISIDTDKTCALEAFKREKSAAIIEIPENYEKDLLSGKPTFIAATVNGFYTVKARIVQATLMSMAMGETKGAIARNLSRIGVDGVKIKRLSVMPVSLVDQNMFNTISGYATYIVPLVSPVILQAVMLMSVALTLGGWLDKKEKDSYLNRVLASRRDFIKCIAGYFLFALLWVSYAEGLDFAMFGYPSMQNFCATFLLMALLCLSIVCVGFMATLLIGTHAYVAQFLVITSAPAVFLSGAIYPTSGFGLLARIVAPFFPATPGIQGMLALSQNGASLFSMMPQLLLLTVQIIVYFLIADFVRQKVARKRGLLTN